MKSIFSIALLLATAVSCRANSDQIDLVSAKNLAGWQEFAVFAGVSSEDQHPVVYVAQFNQTTGIQPINIQAIGSNGQVVQLQERAKFLANTDPVSTAVCPNTGRFLTSFTDAYQKKVRTCVWRSTKISSGGSGTEKPNAGGLIIDRCADDGISLAVGSHYSHAACAGSDWLVVYSMGAKAAGDGYPIESSLDVQATLLPLVDSAIDDLGKPVNLSQSTNGQRNWAPVVAGSGFLDTGKRAFDDGYLAVWQQDKPGSTSNIALKGALLDSLGTIIPYGKMVNITPSTASLKPNTHQVVYLPRFGKFAVLGTTTDEKGIFSLVDPDNANVVTSTMATGPFAGGDVVRVSQNCLSPSVNYDLLAFPTLPTGVTVIKVHDDGSVEKFKSYAGVPAGYQWGYLGVSGYTECPNGTTILNMFALEDAAKSTTAGNTPGTAATVQPVKFDLGKLEGASTGVSSATTSAITATKTATAVIPTTSKTSNGYLLVPFLYILSLL